jgi:hypothetical protein
MVYAKLVYFWRAGYFLRTGVLSGRLSLRRYGRGRTAGDGGRCLSALIIKRGVGGWASGRFSPVHSWRNLSQKQNSLEKYGLEVLLCSISRLCCLVQGSAWSPVLVPFRISRNKALARCLSCCGVGSRFRLPFGSCSAFLCYLPS